MFQTVDINIVPTGEMPVVNVSQYDVNRIIRFCLLNDGEPYTPTNFLKAEFIIRKVDGTLFTQETTILVSNVLELVTTEQMTACAGKNIGEIRLTFNDPDLFEDDVIISTLNFILEVERSPETGGIESESEIANLDGQIADIVDEQLDNYYTKSEIDEQIADIVAEQVTPIVADIVAEQVPPAVQAELGNYYTKDETDTYFYNKTDTDTLLAGKVSTSTLNDYYTKTQVDNLISSVSTDFTTSIDTPDAVQTFADGGDNIPMKSCEVAIVAQQASGTPSPSNPLSITGFSSINAVVSGINLWNEDWEQGLYNNQGVKVANTDAIRAKNPIPVKPSMSYRVVGVSGANRVCYYDVNGTFISTETNVSTSTTPNNCYYMTFSTSTTYGGTYRNNISINYPSTETAYHAYTGTTTPVSLGQTIYGGTAELVGGNGTKTFETVDLGSLTWNYWSGNRFYAVVDNKTAESVLDIICEVYPTLDGMSVADDCVFCMIGNANQKKNIYIQDDSYSHDAQGASDLKTALNGKLAVYRLATPTAFTFTGANIPTLSGVNNLYADSGDINALEYFNNKADDIAALITLMNRS